MNEAELDAIKGRNDARQKLKDAATSGPWFEETRTNYLGKQVGEAVVSREGGRVADCNWDSSEAQASRDAQFIVAARNDPADDDVAALLAEVERLRQYEQMFLAHCVSKFVDDGITTERVAWTEPPEAKETP